MTHISRSFVLALALILTLGLVAQTNLYASNQELFSVEGKVFLEKDLDANAQTVISKGKAELYKYQKQAVDQFLFDHLIQKEAASKKVTSDEVVKQQITDKTKKVSAKDIEAFYNDYKKKAGPRASQMPPLDQISDRIREKLEGDAMVERRAAYFQDLQKKYKVEYKISRPKIDIAVGDMPARGPKGAPVTIVEFSDFECPYCANASKTVEEVLQKYRGKVKLYYRDFPLSFHRNAKLAHAAARCASAQGKFWEYHDTLFENQKALLRDNLLAYAKKHKLDESKFTKCLDDPSIMQKIDGDIQAGAALGVTGTPAFFINGVMLSGAVPLEQFAEIIDEELAATKTARSSVMP